MATKNLYKGFSTYQYEYNKSLTILDVECVKRDLLNHIFTRRGERVKMAQFGTSIPDLLFEPLDQITINTVNVDLRAVFDFDPRVELVSLDVVPNYETHSIVATAILNYIELNLQDRFDLNLQFNS